MRARTVVCVFALLVGGALFIGCGGGGDGPGAPDLTAVAPAAGPAAGGTALTLTGQRFTSSATVSIGGSAASSVTLVSDTSITCVTPGGPAGTPVDVNVTTADGTSTLSGAFRYVAAPALSNVVPPGGTQLGGTLATLNGNGFEAGVTNVTFGGAAATDIAAVSGTSCTCRTPAASSRGVVEVTVTTPGGTVALPGAFTYFPRPVLNSVVPDSDFEDGGSALTLTGEAYDSFLPGTHVVTVGGTAASAVTMVDPWTLACNAPAGTPGLADVALTNSNGTATLPNGFTYFGYPPSFQSGDIRLDTDDAGSALSRRPQICCDGPNIYAVWEDSRNALVDIYFNRSTDGGATWLANDQRLDTDAPGNADSRHPQVCCDGSNVYVVWQDYRDGSPDIRFNTSTDAGTTWLTDDVLIDRDGAGGAMSESAQLQCSGSYVYVVWSDYRNGSADIYFNRTLDGGATWLASDVRLDSRNPGSAISWSPRIELTENNQLYVAWYDYRDGDGDIYFNRSANGGSTWLSSDVRLDTDTAGARASTFPRIVSGGSKVFVFWSEYRTGNPDIYFNHSADGGASWLASDLRVENDIAGTGGSFEPRFAYDGTNLFAVWYDTRLGVADVFLNRSWDDGRSWLASDVRLNTNSAGGSTSQWPEIAVCGSHVFTAWVDFRNGQSDICFNSSRDSGATWLASDLRLDTDPAGMGASEHVRLCCDGARVYAVWSDARNPNYDIRFNRNEP